MAVPKVKVTRILGLDNLRGTLTSGSLKLADYVGRYSGDLNDFFLRILLVIVLLLAIFFAFYLAGVYTFLWDSCLNLFSS
jgi:hypothetical protein